MGSNLIGLQPYKQRDRGERRRVKLVLFCVVKVAELIDDAKRGLTVIMFYILRLEAGEMVFSQAMFPG